MKTVRSGYLVCRRRMITRMVKGETKIIDYSDKIIGFCDTKKVSLEFARSYMNDEKTKIKDMTDFEYHEVIDGMICDYEFDEYGELLNTNYKKDEHYPYIIHKLTNTKNEVFIMYIVSKIKHRTV